MQACLYGDRFVAVVADAQSLHGGILEGALKKHHGIQGGWAEADCCHLRQHSLQNPVWRSLCFQRTLDESRHCRAVYEGLHLRFSTKKTLACAGSFLVHTLAEPRL